MSNFDFEFDALCEKKTNNQNITVNGDARDVVCEHSLINKSNNDLVFHEPIRNHTDYSAHTFSKFNF